MGVEKTLSLLSRNYYWPNIRLDVEKWIRECNGCILNKSRNYTPKSPLIPIRSSEPFMFWEIDFTGPLPVTKNNNKYILVMVDHFSKWVEAVALPDQTAESDARASNHSLSPDGEWTGRTYELCTKGNAEGILKSPLNYHLYVEKFIDKSRRIKIEDTTEIILRQIIKNNVYSVGNRVFLSTKGGGKLSPLFEGPFVIKSEYHPSHIVYDPLRPTDEGSVHYNLLFKGIKLATETRSQHVGDDKIVSPRRLKYRGCRLFGISLMTSLFRGGSVACIYKNSSLIPKNDQPLSKKSTLSFQSYKEEDDESLIDEMLDLQFHINEIISNVHDNPVTRVSSLLSNDECSLRINLPKIQTRPFSCEITELNSFWHSSGEFFTLIQSFEARNKVEPLNRVNGIIPNNENYQTAIDTLIDEYGNQTKLKSVY
ncbi:hypothetical protein RF11_05858 [Thelohanellus kitauei]|uniref:Integrase catalytic domain-containing protein n=1 Tax=Thelohanellus kitauei TaxID=669202 RepID=A0A0C2M271_THEKT|nr:hypothetical protein RF11_05858 [Thelohanellus kitauei]